MSRFLSIAAPFLLALAVVQPGPVLIDAASQKKKDLPNDFPFQIFDVGFAVIRVEIENSTSGSLSIDPDSMLVRAPGGKALKRARPEEITPKLMKYYSGIPRAGRGLGGPMPAPREPGAEVDPRAGSGTVSIEVPARIRSILAHYEIAPGVLEPGQKAEGFLYVRSKKSGSHLSGGRVELPGGAADIK